MYCIDEQERQRREKLPEEHKRLHRILADLHSIASLAPRIHLSNDIGTTKTDVDYPAELSMKLAKEAVNIATERLRELGSELWPDTKSRCKGGDVCGDNRFEQIRFFKDELVKRTNIATSQDEMHVIDSVLFRFWQMGWLNDILNAESQRNADDMAAAITKEMRKRKYGNILASQPGIYADPEIMDVLEKVMDEISDLGWLDILERHQPKEEKANG